MAISITIRNIPDETRDELAGRAAVVGQSLQEYLRAALIDFARRPDPAVLMAQVRARKYATGSRLEPAIILAHRDQDRR